MNTKNLIAIGVVATLLLATLAVAAVEPHTRFTHLNEHCIYYDGVKQCKLRHSFCDPNGKDLPQELGLCANLDETVLAQGEVVEKAYDENNCPIQVTEGDLVEINWISSDPDEDVGPQGYLSYEYEGPIGEDGKWQTKKGDAGFHTAYAQVFDGEFYDETELCINVLKANGPAAVKVVSTDITVFEGETVRLSASCTDPDGDETTIKYTGWMTSDTKTTGYDDAGNYDVTVDCRDPDGEGASTDIKVTVKNKNRPPMIEWEQA